LDKAPDAFRTISEVADDLDIPAHVLRFWETRFVQIKPMKRSGGRRYYRPDDVHLLRGIRRLLYGEGYTIRGVQRILREHGIKAVQGLMEDSAIAPASFSGPSFDHETQARSARSARRKPEDDEEEIEAELEEEEADEDEAEEQEFDEEEEEEEDESEDDEVEVRAKSARGPMDFVPPSSHRLSETRLPEPRLNEPAMPRPRGEPVPVATVPMPDPASLQPRPVTARPASGPSGAQAYAPPSIRNGSAPAVDRDRLKAALDDLVNAREMLDRVLKDGDGQS
jgi:DNA-binding transcriptional MerR regulator